MVQFMKDFIHSFVVQLQLQIKWGVSGIEGHIWVKIKMVSGEERVPSWAPAHCVENLESIIKATWGKSHELSEMQGLGASLAAIQEDKW